MSTRQLIEAFEAWRGTGQQIALATVTATSGSTYSKAGAQMLICGSGQFCGLLSGGCLEGDLVQHARDVLGRGGPKTVRYDMRDRDKDEFWGLGLGCDGAIEIFLQRLDRDYEPFACIARRLAKREACAYALVIENASPELPAGAIAIAGVNDSDVYSVPVRHRETLIRSCRDHLATGGASLVRMAFGVATAEVLCAAVPLPIRLLVLGAGPDAIPLVRIARELGWYVTIGDHRRSYVDQMTGVGADQALEVIPTELQSALDLNAFDAVVIMSHHLQSDRAYLHALVGGSAAYVGLLGPRARRERLLADLGGSAEFLKARVYGPVGLDIGADTPQGIALAIAAEIHTVLKGRGPRHLSTPSSSSRMVECRPSND